MNLAFFLKILTDLCFYSVFAAFFASLYGLTGSILPQLFLIALAAALCRMADSRAPGTPLRLLPLLLCIPAFLLPTQTAGLVILAPAALYAVWTVWSRRFHPGYYDTTDRFQLELKILAGVTLMAVALLQLRRAEQFSLPYLLVFLLGSVLLLRMLRHDEETLRQPRFRLMNLLSLSALCLVCLLVASPWFRQAVGLVFKGIWRVVSIPIFVAAVVIGGVLALFFDAVIPEDFHFDPIQLEGLLMEMGEEEQQQREEMLEAATEADPTVAYVFSIIGILIAAVLMVLLFRWLAAKRRSASLPRGSEVRFSAAPMAPKEKPLTRLNARTPDQQVRYWYQQLLKKTRQEGGELKPTMNTRQQQTVEQEAFQGQDGPIARLRQLYLPARYKGQATPQDAKEAKELYQQIKK